MLCLHDAALSRSVLHWHYSVVVIVCNSALCHGCQALERDMHAVRQARLSFTTAVVSRWPVVRGFGDGGSGGGGVGCRCIGYMG